ncbi:hypothetical protein AYK20_05625 [Thermoplasmatales archaeon SG8-52-1]|nr:MAG: hypothetical protein AYK20_05625 [Thermoplasmatales archaeon SG8-52-1]
MKENKNKNFFTIKIQDKKILFSADNYYSRIWKLTRFHNDRLPEEKVSNLLIKKLNSCKCFVDVGANLGYYTFLASKIMSDGIVYSFEMDDKNYSLLEKNLFINKSKNVKIYHAAITDYSGVVSYSNTLRLPSPILTVSTRISNNRYSIKKSVKAISLDDFFNANGSKPEIIKIDVEGGEIKVLNGMQKLLDNDNLQLFLEVHPFRLKLNFQSSANAIISMLLDKGFLLSEITKMRRHGKDIKLKKLNKESQLMHNTMIYAYKT